MSFVHDTKMVLRVSSFMEAPLGAAIGGTPTENRNGRTGTVEIEKASVNAKFTGFIIRSNEALSSMVLDSLA